MGCENWVCRFFQMALLLSSRPHPQQTSADPCKNTHNDMNRVCRVSPRSRRAELLPRPESCPLKKEPVCGDDGVTYENECVLHRTGAIRGIEIQKLRSGQCQVQGGTRTPCLLVIGSKSPSQLKVGLELPVSW
ncbi:Agrin, partial [Ophiophagus hannah]